MTKSRYLLALYALVSGAVICYLLYAAGLFQYENDALLQDAIVFRSDLQREVKIGLLLCLFGLLVNAGIARVKNIRAYWAVVFFCFGMFLDVLLRWI